MCFKTKPHNSYIVSICLNNYDPNLFMRAILGHAHTGGLSIPSLNILCDLGIILRVIFLWQGSSWGMPRANYFGLSLHLIFCYQRLCWACLGLGYWCWTVMTSFEFVLSGFCVLLSSLYFIFVKFITRVNLQVLQEILYSNPNDCGSPTYKWVDTLVTSTKWVYS